jgi:hypothetical protein
MELPWQSESCVFCSFIVPEYTCLPNKTVVESMWQIFTWLMHCTVRGTLSNTPIVWTELTTLDFNSKGPSKLIQNCENFVMVHTSSTSNHFTKQFLCSYILIMKGNEMHYFSNLFDKVLYMFQKCPPSIIRSISTLCTCSRYLSC